jgi:hypothetical protein
MVVIFSTPLAELFEVAVSLIQHFSANCGKNSSTCGLSSCFGCIWGRNTKNALENEKNALKNAKKSQRRFLEGPKNTITFLIIMII